jgi:ABC-type nitrate/sulfonate/bicarbonate transport system substrate-binding protein
MRLLTLMLAVTLLLPTVVLAQKPELGEVDAWLVRDPQMSAQFAVADQMGYFKEQGLKVTPRWYIAGTDLPSMWGAGNIHLGTATASMVIPIAASGQAIYNIAPQSDIAGTQQIVLGKRGQEILRSPKAVLRALEKATSAINGDREAAVKIISREMKIEAGLARDIMALNVYSMELTPTVDKGMGEFVDFLFGLNRIPQRISPESVFYTKLLKEVDPKLVKWEAKTELK